jgi:hypothetical protein
LKTVSDLLKAIEGREDYEIVEESFICFSCDIYYEGCGLSFVIDFDNNVHTYGNDIIDMIKKENIPLGEEISIWDNIDDETWLINDDFKIDDVNKLIII